MTWSFGTALSVVRTHGVGKGGKPITFQALRKIQLDLPDQSWPLKCQRGVELYQRGTGSDLRICLFASEDSPNPDQGNLSACQPVHVPQHSCAGLKQGFATETTGLRSMGQGCNLWWALNGRVGHYESIHSKVQHYRSNILLVPGRQIRRNLNQQWGSGLRGGKKSSN